MRAAAIQLNSTPDRERTLASADRLVREAVSLGASLVVLPEKWPVLGTPDETAAGAEALDGPSLSWARGIAQELRIDLVAGSVVERVEGSARSRNTCLHVGPRGDDRAVYRKLHLFDVQIEQDVHRESEHFEPGEDIVVSATAAGTGLGLTICYDLRFPELYRALAVRGAEVLCVASDFTVPTTRDHWEVLLRARAIEDQCFVVAANQVGRHGSSPDAPSSGGRSMIVDPWGVVLAQAPDREAVVVADLDLDGLARLRRTLPSLANRRADVLGAAVEVPA